MRVEAAKEAEEAQRAAEVAQKNRTTNVNMMEDSEWVSPYSQRSHSLKQNRQGFCTLRK